MKIPIHKYNNYSKKKKTFNTVGTNIQISRYFKFNLYKSICTKNHTLYYSSIIRIAGINENAKTFILLTYL